MKERIQSSYDLRDEDNNNLHDTIYAYSLYDALDQARSKIREWDNNPTEVWINDIDAFRVCCGETSRYICTICKYELRRCVQDGNKES